MTDAAFKATFSNVKPVLSRGVVQFVFEVPAELATGALNALGGYPRPGEAPWCAIARLNSNPVSAARPAKGPDPDTADAIPPVPSSGDPAGAAPDPMPISSRAAMLSNETPFQLWVSAVFEDSSIQFRTCREWLRDYCGVSSLSELKTNRMAAERFLLIEAKYKDDLAAKAAQAAARKGERL